MNANDGIMAHGWNIIYIIQHTRVRTKRPTFHRRHYLDWRSLCFDSNFTAIYFDDDNVSAWVHIIASHRIGEAQLTEAVLTKVSDVVSLTGPQWVKDIKNQHQLINFTLFIAIIIFVLSYSVESSQIWNLGIANDSVPSKWREKTK